MTTDLRQREEPIRSRHYLDGAKNEPCKLRFDGCTNEGVVSCHLSGIARGMARKEHDIIVVDGCWHCHMLLDTRRTGLSDGEIAIALLRALSETLVARHGRGLLIVREDPAKPLAARPVKPRKPKSERKSSRPIPAHAWPTGRKMQSRRAGE